MAPFVAQGIFPIYQGSCCEQNYVGTAARARCSRCKTDVNIVGLNTAEEVSLFLAAVQDLENTPE